MTLRISLVFLAACNAPCDGQECAYDWGQLAAPTEATLLPQHDPALANCTITQDETSSMDKTTTYDERGRRLEVLYEVFHPDDGYDWYGQSWSYKGPCITETRMDLSYADSSSTRFTCDDKGWPTRAVDQNTGKTTVYENRYSGRRLTSRTTQKSPTKTDYIWKQSKLARSVGHDRRADPDAGTHWTWSDTGKLLEFRWWLDDKQYTDTLVYDGRDRLIETRSTRKNHIDRFYEYAGNDRWPYQYTEVWSGDTYEYPLEFDCP